MTTQPKNKAAQEAGHTPGPWVACSANGGEFRNIECKGAHNDLMPIATCKGSDMAANARLISAAPDLLEALNRIMHYAHMGASACDVDTHDQPEFIKARAAIAKAEGRASK